MSYIPEAASSTNDDMFPGVSSSAFDEHNTTRNLKRMPSDESDWLDKNVEHLTSLLNFNENIRRDIILEMAAGGIFKSRHSTIPGDKKYTDLLGITKYPHASNYLVRYYYSPTGKEFKNIHKYVARLDAVLEHIIELKAKLKKLKTKASTTRRKASAAEMKMLQGTASKTLIPESSIPNTFRVRYFFGVGYKHTNKWVTEIKANPYYSSYIARIVTESYSGHPAHFDWKGREKASFFLLSKLVRNLGLPALDVLYLKRHEKTKHAVFYMANTDKSFQMFKAEYGNTEFYIKDTLIDTWENSISNESIVNIKEAMARNDKQIKKYGKKP